MTAAPLSSSQLLKLVISRLVVFLPLFVGCFFLPAGTLDYWEAWVYLAILLIPMSFVVRYLFVHSPDLLARRMNLRERQGAQKRLVPVTSLILIVAFMLPGFDRRWEWSQVPAWLVLAADACVLLGYALVIWVFVENRYASRVVEVAEEQQVIKSGPYAWVRHPMYLGVILLYGASPLALGSYWALIPALLIIPALVVRILTEEALLHQELQGYTEYTRQVRYRLLPGVW